MKKLIILVAAVLSMQTVYADNTANIKIKIAGASASNRYFLCLPDVGCLSIHAALKGKVYPVYESINMRNIYVMDTDQGYRVYTQGLPASCNKTVEENQTITISGRIVKSANDQVQVKQLRCTVS
jgi:hypothetical protein